MINPSLNIPRSVICALILSTLLFFAVACKKAAVPTSTTSASTLNLPMPASPQEKAQTHQAGETEFETYIRKKFANDPARMQQLLNAVAEVKAEGIAEDKLKAIQHQTMIAPAAADFKPEPVARRVRLKLVFEKTQIHVGQSPRFRLELMNAGREAIDYHESSPSVFVKDADLSASVSTIHFYITHDDKRAEVFARTFNSGPDQLREIEFPKWMTAADKDKWFKENQAVAAAGSSFEIKILPGETLHSIGDDNSPKGNFRTFDCDYDIDTPGKYQLQVVLDDRPLPMNQYYIDASLKSGSTLKELQEEQTKEIKDALGPVSSNIVTFEVLP